MIREDYIKVLDSEIYKVKNEHSDYYKGYREAFEIAKKEFNKAFVEAFMGKNGESKSEFIDFVVENPDAIKLAIDTQDRTLLAQIFMVEE